MEKRSRSLGRTPSHLMSGVVRLDASYDMFMLPCARHARTCIAERAWGMHRASAHMAWTHSVRSHAPPARSACMHALETSFGQNGLAAGKM